MPDERKGLDHLDDLIRIPPFHQFLGVEVALVEPRRCVLRIPPRPEFVGNPLIPSVHGGIISSLIDLAGGAALFVEHGRPTPTIDMRVDFIRPAFAGKALRADARVKSAGKTVAFVDVDVLDEDDRLVAQGRCVYTLRADAAGIHGHYPIG